MNIRKIALSLLAALTVVLLTVAFLFPFRGKAADNEIKGQNNEIESQTADPNSDAPPNYDAFAASSKRSDAKKQNDETGVQKSEGGHLTQFEPRLDVPTFLWASETGSDKGFKSQSSALKIDIEAAAREHLGRYASSYRQKLRR